MCTTTRPLRTLLPLLLVALFMVAAPAPTHATVPAASAMFTDQVIVILNPTTTAGIQIASSPTLVAESLSAETGTSLAYVRPFSAESHILKLSSPRPYAEVEAIAQQLAATPGVLAATLVLQAQYGLWMTLLATAANIILAGITFWQSRWIGRILGKAGSKAFSKIASLLLAAIAVMFIRRGILMLVSHAGLN
ncbi:MAG: MarC family protein [Chloroflexales bacterium]